MYEDFSKVANVAFAVAFTLLFATGIFINTEFAIPLLIACFVSNLVGYCTVFLKDLFSGLDKP